MNAKTPQMKLGLSMQGHGYHHSAWLHPDVPPAGITNFNYYLDMALTAERGLFDMVFLADFVTMQVSDVPRGALGRRIKALLEPITLLAALAPATTRIGLAATASTTFGVPFHIARTFASIDQLSGGRTGWNVVTSFQDDEARNFGSSEILEKSSRYERAEEFVRVVTGLWDSFDPDAFPMDRGSGVYFDPTKMRTLDHVGKHFRVKGPLNVPRSPQGRPIIIQAGASEEGQELAAKSADVVYAVQNTLADAMQFYRSVKGRMTKYGRHADDLKIMPGLLPIIAETDALAEARYRDLQAMIDPLVGLEYLSNVFGDLSAYPLDGPVPELRTDKQLASRSRVLLNLARRNDWSIRQLYQSTAIGNAHHVVVGSPTTIVDRMEEWFRSGAADGFNILPALSPSGIHEFVDLVIPELQKRGLFREAYEGTTLRGNLDLPAPQPIAEADVGMTFAVPA